MGKTKLNRVPPPENPCGIMGRASVADEGKSRRRRGGLVDHDADDERDDENREARRSEAERSGANRNRACRDDFDVVVDHDGRRAYNGASRRQPIELVAVVVAQKVRA
eukprot:1681645-Prymnesium_polylepis.1